MEILAQRKSIKECHIIYYNWCIRRLILKHLISTLFVDFLFIYLIIYLHKQKQAWSKESKSIPLSFLLTILEYIHVDSTHLNTTCKQNWPKYARFIMRCLWGTVVDDSMMDLGILPSARKTCWYFQEVASAWKRSTHSTSPWMVGAAYTQTQGQWRTEK